MKNLKLKVMTILTACTVAVAFTACSTPTPSQNVVPPVSVNSTQTTVSETTQVVSTPNATSQVANANITTGSLDELIQISGLYSWNAAIETAKSNKTGIVTSLDYEIDNGRAVYSIEIMEQNGSTTEVEVSVIDGTIVKSDYDFEVDSDASIIYAATISHEQAIKTALAQSEGSKFKASELDASWNEPVYKVDIIEASGIEKEVVINAKTGEVTAVKNDEYITPQTPTITMSQAEETAKAQTGASTVLYTVLKSDDGRGIYQIKLVGANGQGYEVEIDAQSGRITELDVD